MYVKWTCPACGDIIISNSFRHHQMDMCKCGKSGVDLEEYGCRILGNLLIANRKDMIEYDYNFFDELVICMEQQGFDTTINIGDRLFLDMHLVYLIRNIEDEILGGLK